MLKLMLFSVLVATSFLTDSALASQCYSKDQAEVYISELHIEPESFYGGLDLCAADSQLVLLFQTLDYLRALELPSSMKAPFEKSIIQVAYYDYLKAHIGKIFGPLQRCPGKTAVACAVGEGGIILGPTFFGTRVLHRAGTLIHETRHLESSFPHTTCTQGFEQGSIKGCDQTFSEQGSYAVQVEFLARVYFSKNVSSADRISAKGLALYLMQNKFNDSNFVQSKAMLLVGEDGSLTLFDGNNLKIFKDKILNAQVFARDRNFNVVPDNRELNSFIFDPYMSVASDDASVLADAEALGRAFVLYNQEKPRLKFEDSMRFGMYGEQAVIREGQLEIVSPSKSRIISQLPKLARLLPQTSCTLSEERRINALGADGKILSIHVDDQSFREDSCLWPKEFSELVVLDSKTFVRTQDGQVLVREGRVSETLNVSEFKSATEFNGRRFRQIVRLKEPMFWDFVQ